MEQIRPRLLYLSENDSTRKFNGNQNIDIMLDAGISAQDDTHLNYGLRAVGINYSVQNISPRLQNDTLIFTVKYKPPIYKMQKVTLPNNTEFEENFIVNSGLWNVDQAGNPTTPLEGYEMEYNFSIKIPSDLYTLSSLLSFINNEIHNSDNFIPGGPVYDVYKFTQDYSNEKIYLGTNRDILSPYFLDPNRRAAWEKNDCAKLPISFVESDGGFEIVIDELSWQGITNYGSYWYYDVYLVNQNFIQPRRFPANIFTMNWWADTITISNPNPNTDANSLYSVLFSSKNPYLPIDVPEYNISGEYSMKPNLIEFIQIKLLPDKDLYYRWGQDGQKVMQEAKNLAPSPPGSIAGKNTPINTGYWFFPVKESNALLQNPYEKLKADITTSTKLYSLVTKLSLYSSPILFPSYIDLKCSLENTNLTTASEGEILFRIFLLGDIEKSRSYYHSFPIPIIYPISNPTVNSISISFESENELIDFTYLSFHLELLFYETMKEENNQQADPIYQMMPEDPISTEIRTYRPDLLGSIFQPSGYTVGNFKRARR
jgi:hypothetical protein